MSTQVPIAVNGQPRQVPQQMSLADLLEELGLNPRNVAVEINRELVPRERHAEVTLAQGDHLEIVTLVGGG